MTKMEKFWVIIGKLQGISVLVSLIASVYYLVKYHTILEDSVYYWLEDRHEKREKELYGDDNDENDIDE